MRRLLAIFRAARLFARDLPYSEAADGEGYWNQNDSIALEYFLRGTTGSKLRQILFNYAVRSAMHSVMDGNRDQFQRDVAAGIQMTIAAIEQHLPARVPTDTESEQSESQAALDQLENQTA